METSTATATDPSLHTIPVPLRNLPSTAFPHPLTSQLSEYDPTTSFHSYGITDVQHVNGQLPEFPQPQRQGLQTPLRYPNGSFGLITPEQQHQQQHHHQQHHQQHHQPQQALSFQANQDDSPTKEIRGHFGGMKAIANPPDLKQWREKLFNVSDMITLTEDDFQTYFPHVDNIYSHRSTQRYKRKRFLSHYWDCRLKGRPPGTPKTHDPDKKKRRRTARQRDLCDVKIKITEYFPGAEGDLARPDFGTGVDAMDLMDNGREPAQPFGVLAPSATLPEGHPGAGGARYYTIQRVNGGASGKENEGGGHKHTLDESDAIKKNSVKRKMLKEEKEKKRTDILQKSTTNTNTPKPSSTTPDPSGTTITTTTSSISKPQTRSSGQAAQTARRHTKPAPLTLYGSSFCPFTQRIWIALEAKAVPYRYVETSSAWPLPSEMVEVNPGRKLPCIRHGNWGAWESSIVLEYLEDLSMGHSLLPLGDPQLRAHCRMWCDHISSRIIPSFDSLLITSDPTKQTTLTTSLQAAITELVNASHITGPFFLGPTISFVDVSFAPWIIRLSRVLKYYRQWPDPEVGTRWERWVQAVERDERVRGTVSEEGAYQRAYEGAARKGVPTLMGWRSVDGVAETDWGQGVAVG